MTSVNRPWPPVSLAGQARHGRRSVDDEARWLAVCRAALSFCILAPAARRWRRRSGKVSGSEGERAVAATRAARLGRLEAVKRNRHKVGLSISFSSSGTTLYERHARTLQRREPHKRHGELRRKR